MKTTIRSEVLDRHAEEFAYAVFKEEKTMKSVHLHLYLHILNKLKALKWRHHADYDLHSEKTWEALHISHNPYRKARQKLVLSMLSGVKK